MGIKNLIKGIQPLYKRYRLYQEKKSYFKRFFPDKSELGACGENTFLEYPQCYDVPKNVFVEENVKLRSLLRIINSPTETVTIKKYTVVASNCMIVTNNHCSTVGIPQFLLGSSHIHDRSADIVIEEDVWVGANVTLLPGARLGRGCVVGAGTIVSKVVPPYSIVVGAPFRIIAKKFELEDIIKHEKVLYPEEERLSRDELESLFNKYFEGKKTFGVNDELTKEERDKVNLQKSIFGFVEPSHRII